MSKRKEAAVERERKYRAAQRGNFRMAFITVGICVVVMSLSGGMYSTDVATGQTMSPVPHILRVPTIAEEVYDPSADWQLVLVGKQDLLSRDFRVVLEDVGYFQLDYRIIEPFEQMVAAAADDGVSLILRSAYRNVKQQTQLYENKVAQYRRYGYNEEESLAQAGRYVQPPGASEHHTGLAVDLLTTGSVALDERFAQTAAYAWLQENAAAFGFVERYGADDEPITGIAWEPWHWRYVGPTHAAEMVAQDLTLEEYIQALSNT